MNDKLRVRVYNVRFGDAILVSIPDSDGLKTETRHILIDVGNVLNKEGGEDAVFKPVIDDILNEIKGHGIDLYVMTHEHLDHIQGLCYVDAKVFPEGELKKELNVQYEWITASADPQYYDTHPKARKRDLYEENREKLLTFLDALRSDLASEFRAVFLNNDPRSTEGCVDYIRNLVPDERRYYVYRGMDLSNKHPFREAKFEIWAPEEDTSIYYPKSLLPMTLNHKIMDSTGRINEGFLPNPPPGVDAGAFYDLLSMREAGVWDNLLAIDKAENNSSVVLSIEWRGHTLLFAGDAEKKSWRMMDKQQVIKAVEFLKVSHHGSQTGMPDDTILDKFLPKPVGKKKAAISTWVNSYSGIPHEPTNKKIRTRAELWSTLDKRDELYKDFYFF